jgi:hypothetical protein
LLQPVRSCCAVLDPTLIWNDRFYTIDPRPRLLTRLISIPAGVVYRPVPMRVPVRSVTERRVHCSITGTDSIPDSDPTFRIVHYGLFYGRTSASMYRYISVVFL